MPEDCASLRGSKPVKLAFGGAILATMLLVQVRNCSAEPVTTNYMRELTDASFEENSYSWTALRLILYVQIAEGVEPALVCNGPRIPAMEASIQVPEHLHSLRQSYKAGFVTLSR